MLSSFWCVIGCGTAAAGDDTLREEVSVVAGVVTAVGVARAP